MKYLSCFVIFSLAVLLLSLGVGGGSPAKNPNPGAAGDDYGKASPRDGVGQDGGDGPTPPVGRADVHWNLLTFDDFEGDWGNFAGGGSDCRLYIDPSHAYLGQGAVNIGENNGISSSFYLRRGLDVKSPGYTRIRIEFWFKTLNMSSGDSFGIQYFDGSAWHPVATYAAGTFSNGKYYGKAVTIEDSRHVFPTDMRIRFMCDADTAGDNVFIDAVRVLAR